MQAQIETIDIVSPSEAARLAVWSKLIRRDVEAVRLLANIEKLEAELERMQLSWRGYRSKTSAVEPKSDLESLLSQRDISSSQLVAVIQEALQLAIGAAVDELTTDDDGRVEVASLLQACLYTCCAWVYTCRCRVQC